jgi:hypothetical protein
MIQTSIKSKFDGVIRGTIEDISEQLFLIAKIEDHEKYLDEILGAIFAEIFEMENKMKCFTISQMSYFFFNMFKTNIISNQHRFLILFLSKLRYSQAKEFILYNYSLFSTKEFIENFEKTYSSLNAKPQKVFELEKDYINQFVVNYLSLIDFYKNLTEFKDPSLALKNENIFMKVWRSVGVDLGQMLVAEIAEYSIETFVSEVVERIIKMIPFIGSIPFLDTVADYLVWRIAKFVTEIFMKLFSEYIKIIYKKMTSVIDSLQKKNYSFDFAKIIDEELNPEPPSTKMEISYKNLDSIYYNAYNEKANLFQISMENSRFFKPNDTTVSLDNFKSDIDYFNKYVIGEIIIERLFNSGIPVHVRKEGVEYNLSKLPDYSKKIELYDDLYMTLSFNQDWKNHYYQIYVNDVVQKDDDEVDHRAIVMI